MEHYSTKYGEINHIGLYSLYTDGTIKECMLLGENKLTTEYGILIPQYEYEENRRKYVYSLSFYEDGSIRRIALNNRAMIAAPTGDVEAELITFYQSGKLKRLFPLNGRISAYWDENDEFKLARETTVQLPDGQMKAKVISYCYYEDGALKSLTLWPKQTVKINTPIGDMRVRIGVSYYQNGKLKSVEPSFPMKVCTPIGEIKAFDLNANGISGDKNSLVFSEEGDIRELVTSGMKITVKDTNQRILAEYSPQQELDEDGLEVNFIPLKLSFDGGKVSFNDLTEYVIAKHEFIIEPYYKKAPGMCSDCSSCGKCG